jgi:hypothetical protein
VTRCEKDMVEIKKEYERLYNTTLEADIQVVCCCYIYIYILYLQSKTSGDYKTALLMLIKTE